MPIRAMLITARFFMMISPARGGAFFVQNTKFTTKNIKNFIILDQNNPKIYYNIHIRKQRGFMKLEKEPNMKNQTGTITKVNFVGLGRSITFYMDRANDERQQAIDEGRFFDSYRDENVKTMCAMFEALSAMGIDFDCEFDEDGMYDSIFFPSVCYRAYV